jgi:tetratricopeptide (TPR) repeat protein
MIGRFRFRNLRSGNYYILAEPGVNDYERQTQRVEVRPFNERRGGGGEVFRVDIVMKAREAAKASKPNLSTATKGVIFYQSVPDVAKKEYLSAVKLLDKGSFDMAVASLNRAIGVFPDYYDALELLGNEYVKRNEYKSALPVLSRAVEINKDGWRGFYALGIAQYELNQREDGIRSLKRAVELNPDSANTNMWLGIALAQNSETRSEAIETLKKVTQLAGNSIPAAYFYLGGLYGKTNQYSEAAKAFEDFLKAAPEAGEREKIKQLIEEYRKKAKSKSQPSKS